VDEGGEERGDVGVWRCLFLKRGKEMGGYQHCAWVLRGKRWDLRKLGLSKQSVNVAADFCLRHPLLRSDNHVADPSDCV